jgi:hypothetical protein
MWAPLLQNKRDSFAPEVRGNKGTVWMVGVNIYPKENDLPLLFAPTNICPLGCLDGGVNVDVDERGERDPPQICSNLLPFRGKWN